MHGRPRQKRHHRLNSYVHCLRLGWQGMHRCLIDAYINTTKASVRGDCGPGSNLEVFAYHAARSLDAVAKRWQHRDGLAAAAARTCRAPYLS